MLVNQKGVGLSSLYIMLSVLRVIVAAEKRLMHSKLLTQLTYYCLSEITISEPDEAVKVVKCILHKLRLRSNEYLKKNRDEPLSM